MGTWLKILCLIVGFQSYGALSFTEYNRILDFVEDKYTPIFEEQGLNFVIKRSWTRLNDPAMAGSIPFVEDGVAGIDMWGAYARKPQTTKDGFLAFTCHEIGHHLGGAPYRGNNPKYTWASAEEQADYFVTMKCLRFLWENENNFMAIQNKTIPKVVSHSCYQAYGLISDRFSLCVRSAFAAFEMIKPVQTWKTLSFETPDQYKTKFTYVDADHANDQCRLDTMFQGALCPISHFENFGEDEQTGACTRAIHGETGSRPRCWYLPVRN